MGSYHLGSKCALGGYHAENQLHTTLVLPNVTAHQCNSNNGIPMSQALPLFHSGGVSTKGLTAASPSPQGEQPGEAGEPGGGCHSAAANFYSLELHRMSRAEVTPTRVWAVCEGGRAEEGVRHLLGLLWVWYGVGCSPGSPCAPGLEIHTRQVGGFGNGVEQSKRLHNSLWLLMY